MRQGPQSRRGFAPLEPAFSRVKDLQGEAVVEAKLEMLKSIWQQFDHEMSEWAGGQPQEIQALLICMLENPETKQFEFDPSSLKAINALFYWKEGFPRAIVNEFIDQCAALYDLTLHMDLIPSREENEKEKSK